MRLELRGRAGGRGRGRLREMRALDNVETWEGQLIVRIIPWTRAAVMPNALLVSHNGVWRAVAFVLLQM